jgi:poly(hydroxyalkanoate) depolymerase family esterase
MHRFINTLSKISELGRRLQTSLGSEGGDLQPHPRRTERLQEITGFGSNPGNARMFAYVPEQTTRKPALVVALHGCTQSAASYDHGSGWSTLAEAFGFVVIYPEQQRANNPQGCFSWFVPGDTERDCGEVLSIRQMVDYAISEFGVDRKRVFVTGLSAGGAMASAMLATYPDVFCGGAIIAGLPYGCAATAEEAFAVMYGKRPRELPALGDRVRSASRHRGPWPKISIWHGSADPIVRSSNADDIVRQWTEIHDLPTTPTREEIVCGQSRRVWDNAAGEAVIEAYTIAGMVHGVPLATGAEGCGAVGPFFFDVGISSTHHIASFWGLTKIGEKARNPAASGALTSAQIATRRPLSAALPNVAGYVAEPADRAASREENRAAPGDPNAAIAAAFKAAGFPDLGANTSKRNQPAPAPFITAALKAAGLLKS